MSRWIYNVFFLISFLLYLPYLLGLRIGKKKYRKSFWQRLGCKSLRLPQKLSSPTIWIHAVSLGESKAAAPFIHELIKSYPNASIIISSVTETGFAEIQRLFPNHEGHFFLPFDFPWTMRSLVKKIKPDLFVLVEGDFWFNLLYYLKKFSSKVLLINGKISLKSYRRQMFFKKYSKRLFSLIDFFCFQNSIYQQRFLDLGVPSSKCIITGNIKFDCPIETYDHSTLSQFRQELGFKLDDLVVTIGSTHPGEEKLLLKALQPLMQKTPNLKIILVPRHIERTPEIEKEIAFCNFTKWSNKNSIRGDEEVILLDATGLLKKCYAVSQVSIVAGSFVDIGGHNLLEPLDYGLPVIYGPYIHKQQELSQIVLDAKVGFQIPLNQLSSELSRFLQDNLALQALKERAFSLKKSFSGASLKSFEQAKNLINEKNINLF